MKRMQARAIDLNDPVMLKAIKLDAQRVNQPTTAMAGRQNSNQSGMVLDGLSKQLQLTTNELLASNRTPKPNQEASRSEL